MAQETYLLQTDHTSSAAQQQPAHSNIQENPGELVPKKTIH